MEFPAQCRDTQDNGDGAKLFFFFFFRFFDICLLESCYAYISYTKNDAFDRHEKMKTVGYFRICDLDSLMIISTLHIGTAQV